MYVHTYTYTHMSTLEVMALSWKAHTDVRLNKLKNPGLQSKLICPKFAGPLGTGSP